MIKHIVMFRLKDSAEGHSKAENARKLKILLEALKEKIPVVKCLEVGINVGKSASASDIVLYSEFDDMQMLEVYREHPEHKKAVDFITKVCSEKRVVDYEV
ncbi:MAG: Dabb family protein [Deltaproteobacteria bacterium]|nr:Dabb family protein [Deltaproteobacteria bacterium]